MLAVYRSFSIFCEFKLSKKLRRNANEISFRSYSVVLIVSANVGTFHFWKDTIFLSKRFHKLYIGPI